MARRGSRVMAPALFWLATFVLGLAIGVGTIWFDLVVLALVPVLALIAASDLRRIGLSGVLLGFGGFYLLESGWALLAAVLVVLGLAIGLFGVLDRRVSGDRATM